MPSKQSKPPKYQSKSDQAIAIYREHLKLLEDGDYDYTRSWRQSVLLAFQNAIDASPASLASFFVNAQKAVGRKVSRDFEIEVVGGVGTPSPIEKRNKRPAAGLPTVSVPLDTDPLELTLVPMQGPIPSPPKPTAKVPLTVVGAPAAVAVPKKASAAKEQAEKVHADLIALSKAEIEEAFQTLEELIDNVDQMGDAKTLRKFVRQVRSACKQIEDQLATKTLLDRKQANKILAGLQMAGDSE